MKRAVECGYAVLLFAAAAWAIFNCLYVYLVLGGARYYRIESAVLLFGALALPLVVSRAKPLNGCSLTRTQIGVLLIAILLLWSWIFVPLVSFPLLSDDYVFLDVYTSLGQVTHARQFFRPLFATVFMALARIGGGSPLPFHVAGIALHIASALLFYSLAKRLFGGTAPAVLAFAMFLLNPLQLEATLWPSGLQELLWSFFMMCAVWWHVGAETPSARRMVVTMALVAAALLSKETAVCFVLLLPAADLLFFGADRFRRFMPFYAALAALLVAYLVTRRSIQNVESSFFVMPSPYFVKQFLSIPYRFFAQPWNAAVLTVPNVWRGVVTALLVGLSLAAIWRSPSRRLLAGPALILISTLPLYSFFWVREDLMAARYIYFAAFGWALLVAELLNAVLRRSTAWLLVIASIAVALAFLLEANLRPWRTAAEIVTAMRAGLERGEPLESTIAGWRALPVDDFRFKDGVPYDYKGVGIFINGYPEFQRIVLAR